MKTHETGHSLFRCHRVACWQHRRRLVADVVDQQGLAARSRRRTPPTSGTTTSPSTTIPCRAGGCGCSSCHRVRPRLSRAVFRDSAITRGCCTGSSVSQLNAEDSAARAAFEQRFAGYKDKSLTELSQDPDGDGDGAQSLRAQLLGLPRLRRARRQGLPQSDRSGLAVGRHGGRHLPDDREGPRGRHAGLGPGDRARGRGTGHGLCAHSERPAADAAARRASRPARRGSRRCASACHGADGKGNQALGAPNLTDNIWLHGGSVEDIRETITNGRTNHMPRASRAPRRDQGAPARGLRAQPVAAAGAPQAAAAAVPALDATQRARADWSRWRSDRASSCGLVPRRRHGDDGVLRVLRSGRRSAVMRCPSRADRAPSDGLRDGILLFLAVHRRRGRFDGVPADIRPARRAVNVADAVVERPLYAAHQKVYPREVSGRFARLRGLRWSCCSAYSTACPGSDGTDARPCCSTCRRASSTLRPDVLPAGFLSCSRGC